MSKVFLAWGNVYEMEPCGELTAIYRRIPLGEYLDYYMGDTRVEHCGEIRRLFLMAVSPNKATQIVERSRKAGCHARARQ
ncbi:MAG: hypothetical protein ABF904_05570 [Ethanoligenens sp.]